MAQMRCEILNRLPSEVHRCIEWVSAKFGLPQLKVGSANQRYPLLTSSNSSQQKFK
jgi:hypothetical protein